MSVLARAVVVLEGDSAALDKVMSAAEARVQRAGKLMSDVGKTLTTRVTLPIVALGGLSVRAFGEQADAIARTKAILTATGGSAGVTAEHIGRLAASLQETTRFADEVTESAAGILLTFTNIANAAGRGNDVFDRTVKVAQGMASLFEVDLQSAMFLVGKALEDPAEGLQMLQRRTRAFSSAQEDMIKKLAESGRVLEAQKLILNVLESKGYGTLAAAMAKTPIGRMKQAWNELGEAMEDVGQIIAAVILPAVDKVRDLARAFQRLGDGTKLVIVVMAAAVAAVGPLLVVIGTLLKVGVALSIVLGSFAAPVAAGVLAFGALVAAGTAMIQNWAAVKMQALLFWSFLKDRAFEAVAFILKHVESLLVGLGSVGVVMKNLPGPTGLFGLALDKASGSLTAASDGVHELRDSLQAARDIDLQQLNVDLVRLQGEIDAAGASVEESGKKIDKALRNLPAPPPAWLKPAKEAVDKLNESLAQASALGGLFGKDFDLAAARAKAYEEAIVALVAAHVPLNVVLPGTSLTLTQLAARYSEVQAAAAMAAKAQQAFDDAVANAKTTVTQALTPQQQYWSALNDLATAFVAGKITEEQFDQAVKHLQGVLKDASKETNALGQAIHDMAGRAVDDFVDFAFGAGKSFGDFVRQALIDLTKLILKIELLKLLFPEGTGGKFLGGILGFAAGGFLGPGQVGLVGERGPELISGGRAGLTVTPTPATGASVIEAGASVTVNVNVSAIDGRDTARFFEENEGLLAGTMLSAFRKSSALNRRFGG